MSYVSIRKGRQGWQQPLAGKGAAGLTFRNGAGRQHPFHPQVGAPLVLRTRLEIVLADVGWTDGVLADLGWNWLLLKAELRNLVARKRIEREEARQKADQEGMHRCPRGGGHWVAVADLDNQGRWCREHRNQYMRTYRARHPLGAQVEQEAA